MNFRSKHFLDVYFSPNSWISQEIGNVPLSALGEVVASLREQAETIIEAIDRMLNRGFD